MGVLTMGEAAQGRLTAAERGLALAMADRYQERDSAVAARTNWTPRSYVSKMRALWQEHVGDADVAVLYVDAAAAAQGFQLSNVPATAVRAERDDYKDTPQLMRLLTGLLPTAHPYVLHLHIHFSEGLALGGRCQDSADLLRGRVPDSGHLMHMPSHCYLRTGRYADAAQCSSDASSVDRRYLANGYHPYLPEHNLDVVLTGLLLSGQYRRAVEAATTLMQGFGEPSLYIVNAQSARWRQILDAKHQTVPAAEQHFGLALAYAAVGDQDSFAVHRRALSAIVARQESKHKDGGGGAMAHSTNVAAALLDVLRARAAMLRHDEDAAVSFVGHAVNAQLHWPYHEPPPMISFGPCLGELLLQVADLDGAERAFRQDLVVWPDNGFALLGLVRIAKLKGKPSRQLQQAFDEAWRHADYHLPNSCPMLFDDQH